MLDLDRAVAKIKKLKAKKGTLLKSVHGKKFKVLLQFPDGLKPKATSVDEYLEKETGCKCFIWAGSCYGACDVPSVEGFDLLLQFGHNKFGFNLS